MADFYCPLDEFEFEYKGRWVSCAPAGGAIASGPVGGQARSSKPIWDIQVDGIHVGQFDAEMNETQESVRDAAVKLAEELDTDTRM